MMKKEKIKCSVIVLNYFGEKVIESTINSLLKLNFPKNEMEIIIVDNASKDKSRKIINTLISKNKKLIKKIFLKENFGFSKGNNRGIEIAKGKYVVLLNNDCVVEKNWLLELYNIAKRDNNIFSVGSKILLYPKYFLLQIPWLENLWLHKIFITKSNLLRFTKDKKIEIPFKYAKGKFICEIPHEETIDNSINLLLSFDQSQKVDPKSILSTYQNIFDINKIIKNKKEYLVYCSLNTDTISSYSKIQNAGSIVFQDGYGRDIGAEVEYQTQNYENENGQFNKTKEVYSTCGAAVLYNKNILEKIGYLDESFFMYYEDTEISERARILGYKNYYSYKAIVRHLHALSSREWSPFFIYNVEKSRLLHIFYTFPFNVFAKEYLKFGLKNTVKFIKNINNKNQTLINSKKMDAFFNIFLNYLKYQKNKSLKRFNNDNINLNYKSITNGYWYFN